MIRKGDFIYNVNTGKKIKVRLNSNFHVPARQLSHCFLLSFEQGPLKALTIGYSNIFNLKDHKRLLAQYAMRNIKGADCIVKRVAFSSVSFGALKILLYRQMHVITANNCYQWQLSRNDGHFMTELVVIV